MEIHEIFNSHAKNYDKQRKKLIPCFDDFYGIAIDVIDIKIDNPRVLDLGAGTGLFSSFLLEKYPSAQITLIDLASNMLDEAKKRFQDNSNIEYIVDDYLTHEFNSKFDIIISSLSIHHLTKLEKHKLYEKYVSLLNKSGVIVNADLVLDENSTVEEFFFHKTDEMIIPQVSTEEFEKVNKRREYDKQDTAAYQLDCLKDSGCRFVGIPYKFYNYAVLWARK